MYICDYHNDRIQILNLDFEYVCTIKIDGIMPYKIQISESTIGVSCNNATLFYDLKSRTLKYKHNHGTNLNYIDSTFFGSNRGNNKLYFFDSDGHFTEEMVINDKLSKPMSDELELCRHKNDLYLKGCRGKLLKFSR